MDDRRAYRATIVFEPVPGVDDALFMTTLSNALDLTAVGRVHEITLRKEEDNGRWGLLNFTRELRRALRAQWPKRRASRGKR